MANFSNMAIVPYTQQNMAIVPYTPQMDSVSFVRFQALKAILQKIFCEKLNRDEIAETQQPGAEYAGKFRAAKEEPDSEYFEFAFGPYPREEQPIVFRYLPDWCATPK